MVLLLDTPLLERVVLGTSVDDWIIALCVFAGATILFGLVKRLVVMRLAKLAERTETDLDDLVVDLVRRTARWFLIVMAARLASHWLTLSTHTHDWLSKIAIVATFVQVGLWGMVLVNFGMRRLMKAASADETTLMGGAILSLVGRAIVWSTVLLMCLSALSIDVTALITGLGVSGIAVALALQNILGDLFASMSIVLDKPFVVGDSIVIGDFAGTVEEIGIKTTRLRSVNGEQIVVGNSDLVHSRIRNYKRLTERRSLFTVGVTYATRYEQLERIPGLLRELVESTPHTRFERAHFKTFADWALVFEVVYFSTLPEYNALMDVQQAINLKIKQRFEQEGIDMAFPTQTVIHVNADPAANPVAPAGPVPARPPGR